MPLVELEDFGDVEPTLIFLTPSLREAKRVEGLLNEKGVDYAVSIEPCGRTLFGTPRSGAAFYVAEHQAAFCRAHLTSAGLALGVLTAEDAGASE